MTYPKPTIFFLPGGFCVPSLFDPIRTALSAKLYPSTSVEFPSMSTTATEDPKCDIEAIKITLTQLIEKEEKEVVLVMHSYSGLPGSEATKGFGKYEHLEQGKKGGVIALVYMMSFLLPEGTCLAPAGDLSAKPTHVDFNPDTGLLSISEESAIEVFFHDIDKTAAEKYASQLIPQSPAVFTLTTTYMASKHIPTTFIICESDRVMPVQYARTMVEQAQASSSVSVVVETSDAGHFPFLSRVDWTTDVLVKAAERV